MGNPEITIKDGEGKDYSFPLLPKEFSTGSKGYFINGTVILKNKQGELKVHTFSLNIVEKGSKPKDVAKQ